MAAELQSKTLNNQRTIVDPEKPESNVVGQTLSPQYGGDKRARE